MKFLVDENLSPRLSDFLTLDGNIAEHVRDAVGSGAADAHVLETAVERRAVIVTADTDFGTLLVRSGGSLPSVLLVHELLRLSVADQGRRHRDELGAASCSPDRWGGRSPRS